MSYYTHNVNVKVIVNVKEEDIVFGDNGTVSFYPFGAMVFTSETISRMKKILLNKLIPNWAKYRGFFRDEIDSYLEDKYGTEPTSGFFEATITISDKIIIDEMSLVTESDEYYDFPLNLLPAQIKYKLTVDDEIINDVYLDEYGYSTDTICLVLSDECDSDDILSFIYTENDCMPHESDYPYPLDGEFRKIRTMRDSDNFKYEDE
jgi:hypothetical protein